MGADGKEGQPTHFGAPINEDEVKHAIEHGIVNPFRTLIRHSDRKTGWARLHEHPDFAPLINAKAKQLKSRSKNSEHTSGVDKLEPNQVSVGESESFRPYLNRELNQKELYQAKRSHSKK